VSALRALLVSTPRRHKALAVLAQLGNTAAPTLANALTVPSVNMLRPQALRPARHVPLALTLLLHSTPLVIHVPLANTKAALAKMDAKSALMEVLHQRKPLTALLVPSDATNQKINPNASSARLDTLPKPDQLLVNFAQLASTSARTSRNVLLAPVVNSLVQTACLHAQNVLLDTTPLKEP